MHGRHSATSPDSRLEMHGTGQDEMELALVASVADASEDDASFRLAMEASAAEAKEHEIYERALVESAAQAAFQPKQDSVDGDYVEEGEDDDYDELLAREMSVGALEESGLDLLVKCGFHPEQAAVALVAAEGNTQIARRMLSEDARTVVAQVTGTPANGLEEKETWNQPEDTCPLGASTDGRFSFQLSVGSAGYVDVPEVPPTVFHLELSLTARGELSQMLTELLVLKTVRGPEPGSIVRVRPEDIVFVECVRGGGAGEASTTPIAFGPPTPVLNLFPSEVPLTPLETQAHHVDGIEGLQRTISHSWGNASLTSCTRELRGSSSPTVGLPRFSGGRARTWSA